MGKCIQNHHHEESVVSYILNDIRLPFRFFEEMLVEVQAPIMDHFHLWRAPKILGEHLQCFLNFRNYAMTCFCMHNVGF